MEGLVANLQKPVEEDAFDKVQEERKLIMEGKVLETVALEVTSMEEEFAELVAEMNANALNLDPEK